MKKTFYCQTCDYKFNAKPTKIQTTHPIFGPGWKLISNCPKCNKPADQVKDKLSLHKNHQHTSCSTGTCPFA